MIAASEALTRLREGNQRFVSGRGLALSNEERRGELAAGQSPFAVIFGCSDSRVPVETIFDQGLGDLFVVRVAGNVVTSPQVGSIEFAVESFGTPLVVVLGHTGCGAVQATLETVRDITLPATPHLASIIESIRPSVEPLLATSEDPEDGLLMARAVRANIQAATNQLQQDSAALASRIQRGQLRVIGAEYCLDSGVVEFFDNES